MIRGNCSERFTDNLSQASERDTASGGDNRIERAADLWFIAVLRFDRPTAKITRRTGRE
jgi:hypothetical protein